MTYLNWLKMKISKNFFVYINQDRVRQRLTV